VKRATKAVLLSALVFPGLGHLYLKRWAVGVVLLAVAGYAAYAIGSVTMTIATDVVQKIESGGLTPDVPTITNLVNQQMAGKERSTDMAELAFAACWLMGIIGSYIHGRAQDRLASRPELRM
jgi:hypothetical protein